MTFNERKGCVDYMLKDGLEKQLINEEKKNDIIMELRKEKVPLVIWGAGNVAEAVREYLYKNNIFPVAAWVDGENKKNYFEDIPILSLNEIKKRYKKFNVILGHSCFELGETAVYKERQINRMFYLVSILYEQFENISYKFVECHMQEYCETYQVLEDDDSKCAMAAYLNTRINNNIKYVKECVKYEQNYFKNDIYQIGMDESYVDIGAFDGDTIRLFLKNNCNKYKKIFAFEPEEKNFADLQSYIKAESLKEVHLYKLGTWKEKGKLYFQSEKEKSSSISRVNKGDTILVDTLDSVLGEEDISLIKINFYFGVLESLAGAKKILQRRKPKLAISVGFDEWALIKVPQFLKACVPEYKMYLRYNRCMPACLTLYAK